VSEPVNASVRKVQAALATFGLFPEIVEFPQGTRTAAEAAAAIGCRVEQIVKSLVFRGAASGAFVLVLAGGANRVDEKKVAAHLGEKIEKADAAFVREQTGFAIGGVPPVGHLERPVTLIDEDLLGPDELWAAAGTPNTVFRLSPADLVRMAGGAVVAVRKPGV